MRLQAHPSGSLRGAAGVPGDKSISHRALMLAAMAAGESRIAGLLEGADVLATAAALVFMQSLLGGLVRHLEAGMACPDVPLCLGRIVPPLDHCPLSGHC